MSHPSPSSVVPPDLSSVPVEYHNLGEVFSKERALSLPSHQPYNCAINLVPGSTLPSSHLYNLSRPKREAMEEYIGNPLWQLASSDHPPLLSGQVFFFVAKKNKTLRPCIDFEVSMALL